MEVFIKSRASLCGFDSDKQEDRQTGTKALSAALDRRTSPQISLSTAKPRNPPLCHPLLTSLPPFLPSALPHNKPLFLRSIMSVRLLQFSRQSATTARPLPPFPFRRPFNAGRGRRFQSTIAEDSTAAAQQSFLRRIWNSPVGAKTVHFWLAPSFFSYYCWPGLGWQRGGYFFLQ